MKGRRLAIGLVAVVLLTLALMRVAGSLRFSPEATDLLVRTAGPFGAHGDEAVLDFYMIASGLLSLVVAVVVVVVANRWIGGGPRLDSNRPLP